MIHLKKIYHETLNAFRQFPVEALLGLTFFIIAYCSTVRPIEEQTVSKLNGVLALSFQMLVLTYLLNKYSDVLRRIGRWLYWGSYFIYIPLLFVDLSQFEQGFSYGFAWLLALLMLVAGRRSWNDRRYASEVLHTITQAFFTALIGGLLIGVGMLIWLSIVYIFDIEDDFNVNIRIAFFVIFMVMPLLFCSFDSHESKKDELPKILTIIFNFIISPAVIVYAVIMYVYLITIVVNWQLPKGGVAYMVMGLVLVALLCMLVQRVLKKRYYDWFFNHFTWISIAPLVLFWTGTLYRISQYGLTESRVYLLVAGCAMILFVIMLLREQWCNFRMMVLISCCAIIIFTYLPGISAKSIGYRVQQKRFDAYVMKLHLIDNKTNKLITNVDSAGIKNDSITNDQLYEVSDIYNYMSEAVGSDKMVKQYGECNFGRNDENGRFFSSYRYSTIDIEWNNKDFDLGQYTLLQGNNNYDIDQLQEGDDAITIRRTAAGNGQGKVVLTFPIKKIVDMTKNIEETITTHPEKFLTYKNDSLLFVMKSIKLSLKNKECQNLHKYDISGYNIYKKK